jgi:hypothetical protein
MRGCILAHPDFAERPADDDHGGLLTAFARKYQARGRQPYLAVFARRASNPQPPAPANTRSV